MFDIRLKHPFTLVCNGSTSSGKTTWIFNLLNEPNLIRPVPDHVFYYYASWQNQYRNFKSDKITFIKGSLNEEEIIIKSEKYKKKNGSLFIMDDGMFEIKKDMVKIFTVLSHHQNASVILVTHNLFYNNPIYRIIALNTHYLVIMKSARTMSQIKYLLMQLFNKNYKKIESLILKIFQKNYSYIILDCHPNGNDEIKLLTNIFYKERPLTIIYKKSV